MQIRAFDAATLKDAMRHVRHALGPAAGVPGHWRASLAASAETSHAPETALTRALSHALTFLPLPAVSPHPLLIVGTAGAGKTASAGKLAARAALRGGAG